MRTAFISDIHGNLDALKVVLDDIATQEVDQIVCLGDIVGYGPEPNECAAKVKEVCVHVVAGNHDYAALERMDTLGFNEYARAAADWTTKALSQESRDYLNSLPLAAAEGQMRFVHASPLDPERWTYVLSFEEAIRQFDSYEERLCFIGHSHLPVVIENDNGEIRAYQYPEDTFTLDGSRRYMVNVGSVGQPRDRDPRAGYIWYDDAMDAVFLRRLEYPVEVVQKKILDAGLPSFLAQRLAAGM